MCHMESWFPYQGSNLHTLHWRVFTGQSLKHWTVKEVEELIIEFLKLDSQCNLWLTPDKIHNFPPCLFAHYVSDR